MKTIILLLAVVAASSGTKNYYVGSDATGSCVGYDPCQTLQQYASNQSQVFISNTSFTFLPGTHTLNDSIWLGYITNVELKSSASSIAILECDRFGGLIFEHATNIRLSNLTFVHCGQPLPKSLQRDGETAQAALAFGEVTDLLLDSISVSHSAGYGMLGHCVHGDFTITSCAFSFNKGNAQYLGGNSAIEFIGCNEASFNGNSNQILISDSNFTHGDYEAYIYFETLATGLSMILSQTNTRVLLSNVVIESNRNNEGYKGGNLFIHFSSFIYSNVTITNSTISNGMALLGAGIDVSIYSSSTRLPMNYSNVLSIQNSFISRNQGIVGSGLRVNYQLENTSNCCPYFKLKVKNCTFESNEMVLSKRKVRTSYLGNGVAVHLLTELLKNELDASVSGYLEASFEDCRFNNNYFVLSNTTLGAIAMTFVAANTAQLEIKNCNFSSNSFTALGAYRSKVVFSETVMMNNNTGINGGGLMLCESSYIVLSHNTTLSFISNHAVQSGGAIYVESKCLHTKPYCFFQLKPNEVNCDFSKISESTKVIMINNTAGNSGEHIYGGSLDNCYIYNCSSNEAFASLFKYNSAPGLNLSTITSDPRKICFCREGKPNCTVETLPYKEQYPGSSITIYAVIVGQFDGTVPGIIVSHILNSDVKSVAISTGKTCTALNVQILSEKLTNITVKLLLNNLTYLTDPLQILVPIAPCPLGFIHRNNTCECDMTLQNHRVECVIANQSIRRTPPAWIGYVYKNNRRYLVYHDVCPYKYCVDAVVYVTSNDSAFDQDIQCAPNHTGLLCSKCKEGFGFSVGTFACLKCETKAAVSLLYNLGFLLVGILLVLFLAMFDITYTNGCFSGLLFYANIIDLHSFIFYPSNRIHAISFTISWMNLNSGFDYCIFNGVDAYLKSWLDFVFPTYVLLITCFIVFLCRKFDRVAWMFSENIVQVLATLLQLCYTRLMQSVVLVLSFTQIQYRTSGNDVKGELVWLADPDIQYFHGKHIPLALVAIVFGLLILAYTLVLLFIQPLQRYSHLRCFTWVAKLKPLIDAYTAPHIIKDHCRYWEGLLLLLRLILAAVATTNIRNENGVNLMAISSVTLLLLSMAWSVGGIYKKAHLNLLNSFSILNLAGLSILSLSRDDKYPSNSASTVSFGLAFLIFLGVVATNIYMKMKKWALRCRSKEYRFVPLDTAGSFSYSKR